MSTMEKTFPTLLDSTMLATFKKCRRKFYEEYILWLIPKEKNQHFVAGGAYAKGQDVFRQAYYGGGYSFDDALAMGWEALTREFGDYEPPEKSSSKNWVRTAGAYLQYYNEWDPRIDFIAPVLFEDGSVATETSFAHPLPGVIHPVTGDPILYGGRFDSIMTMVQPGQATKAVPLSEARSIFIYDDKTTKSMGSTWADQWTLRSQFTGYQWGMQENDYRATGVIVRGLGILKEKCHCVHTQTSRPPWQVYRWLKQTVRTVQEMIRCWEDDYWDYNLDDACSSYGGCPYRKLCESPDPSPWYAGHFKKNTWSPVFSEDAE